MCFRLKQFYEARLGAGSYPSGYIQVGRITDQKDPRQLVRLLELVLRAAVQSARKELIVDTILKLDDEDQTQLMVLMERVAAVSSPSGPEASVTAVEEELEFARGQLRASETRVAELEDENRGLRLRLEDHVSGCTTLRTENEAMRLEIGRLSVQVQTGEKVSPRVLKAVW